MMIVCKFVFINILESANSYLYLAFHIKCCQTIFNVLTFVQIVLRRHREKSGKKWNHVTSPL